MIPSGFQGVPFVPYLLSLAAIPLLWLSRENLKFKLPRDIRLLGVLTLVVVLVFSFVAVLSPSTAEDWDSLAYHMAVPKLWIAAGHIYSVPSLHHSNFPDVIDSLYVWGLKFDGQSGAKAFSFFFLALGILATFGFARQRYGEKAGWWSAIAFATIPAIMWESGTAYIDLGHGLYAGLGIAFAALAASEGELEASPLALSTIFLGLAAASKYTGLQTILVVGVALFIFVFAGKSEAKAKAAKSLVIAAVAALAIASPWYIKNIVLVKNPVYPFVMGGANWDQRRAAIYKNQQQEFGVGRTEEGRDKLAIGASVLGLGYQPGRYVDPGETVGLGAPTGALGIAMLIGLFLWPLSGKAKRFENLVLVVTLLFIGMWFFLSQQSRYFMSIAPPAAILLGGLVVRLRLGQVVAGLTALQALYSVWLFGTQRYLDQMEVVTGRVSADDYQTKRISFYGASKEINKTVGPTGKVALYDEVFGFLLDVPYMWANPGHSTLIPYDSMSTPDDFVEGLKKLGFTHVYINLSSQVKARVFAQRWVASMALNGVQNPLPPEEVTKLTADWQSKWEVLLAEAAANGKLHFAQSYPAGTFPAGDRFPRGILFSL